MNDNVVLNGGIPNIPASEFEFVPEEGRMHDKKLETKPISYFKDVLTRFCRNKSSVVSVSASE